MTIKRILFLLFVSSALASLFCAAGLADDKIKIRTRALQSDSVKVWIFLHDKGDPQSPLSKKVAVTDRAQRRRALRGGLVDTDACDREVNSGYVQQVTPLVRRIAQRSRWLNAVSAWAAPSQLDQLANLGCVDSIKEVAVFHRLPEPIAETKDQDLLKPQSPYPPDYGPSFQQAAQIEADALHSRGLTGAGITILMLDTGFKVSHPAFAQMTIDSTWDFINNDVDVEDAAEAAAGSWQQSHGTSTLSIVGGYDYGNIIGIAYSADFLLAKTEIYGQEIEVEEDNWVAGIEWGERLGADVASSSLGYMDWYTWQDMDGNTAACTIAADSAARLGMIVVNAAGNEGRTADFPTLIAPADGDSVIAVGAVNSTGQISGFSSNGPTFDGRIKPDVCAMGVDDRLAVMSGGYGNSSGTSFATPLVAGVCALLLQGRPNWHYDSLYQAITSTATQASSPDSVYGYGIVRAYQALNFGLNTNRTISGVVAAPNPFTGAVDFLFSLQAAGEVRYRIYTVAGEKLAEKAESFTPCGDSGQVVCRLSWDGRNYKGDIAAAGVYIVYFAGPGIETTLKIFKKE